MGCDIHAHIEVKIKGVWHHYSCPPMPRHYALFERICGVRGDVRNAIAPPRGFPNNACIVTKACFDHDGVYVHSATVLDKQEFCDLIDWAEKESGEPLYQHKYIGYLGGNSFHLHPGSNPKEIQDVRFICWFDN